MNSTSMTLIALALTTATPAFAQSTQFLSYGADYTRLSDSGNSATITGANAGIDYRSNAFILNGNIGFNRLSSDDESGRLTTLDARVGYIVVEHAVVYGGIDYVKLSDDDDSLSGTSYNVGGEYYVNGLTLGVNYDDSDEDDYQASTTLYASYQVNDDLEAAVGFTDIDGEIVTQIGADYDNGQFDLNAYYANTDGSSLFGLNGSYDLGNRFRVNGEYVDFDGLSDQITVGGGYELSEDLWVDVSFGQLSDNDGFDADVIGVAIKYEMGRETLLIDRSETLQAESLGFVGLLLQ